MAHINDELGIPVTNSYDNMVGYENASGRRAKRQQKRAERKEARQERRADRKEARQERRQSRREGRNTQRVTTGDRNAAEEWLINSFGNNLMQSKTLEELEYLIGVMSDQKANAEEMLGKRKSGVGRVLSFGRQYKRRGKSAGMCTSDQCIRENQARLDALNNFETQYRTQVDTLRKKLEKLEKPPVTEGGSTGSGTGEGTSGGGSLTGSTQNLGSAIFTGGIVGSGTAEEQGGGDSSLLKDEDKQKKLLLYGVGGLAILGIGYYFFVRK